MQKSHRREIDPVDRQKRLTEKMCLEANKGRVEQVLVDEKKYAPKVSVEPVYVSTPKSEEPLATLECCFAG